MTDQQRAAATEDLRQMQRDAQREVESKTPPVQKRYIVKVACPNCGSTTEACFNFGTIANRADVACDNCGVTPRRFHNSPPPDATS
jgi:transcription elongation factor Elf1